MTLGGEDAGVQRAREVLLRELPARRNLREGRLQVAVLLHEEEGGLVEQAALFLPGGSERAARSLREEEAEAPVKMCRKI